MSCIKHLRNSEPLEVGEYKGFKVLVQNDSFLQYSSIVLRGAISHKVDMGLDAIGNIQRMDNVIKNMPDTLSYNIEQLKSTEEQLEAAKEAMNTPFEYESELNQKSQRLKEITQELELDKKDNVVDDGDYTDKTPQHQYITFAR